NAHDEGTGQVDDRDILVRSSLLIGYPVSKQPDTGEAVPKGRPLDDLGGAIALNLKQNWHFGIALIHCGELTGPRTEYLPAIDGRRNRLDHAVRCVAARLFVGVA